MAVPINSDEARTLRKLIPIASFSNSAFAQLCADIKLELVQDAAIFKKGDTNTDLVYLLNGSVSLQADNLLVEVITSENESAKFALAHQIPRKIDAVANGKALIVRLATELVNNRPTDNFSEEKSYTITEDTDEDSDDWMSVLLRSPIFQDLPAANLQKILISLKTSHFEQGQAIIANGTEINHFYFITKGQCLLSRPGMAEMRIGLGESFGEEYLMTDRHAKETITALSDVHLIQLEKSHFLTQIKIPLLQFISYEELPDALNDNGILLDIRLPQHYENNHLNNSVNIPLAALRMRLAEIPQDKHIIIVCGNGKASEAAAFLLINNKYNASILKDGMGLEEADDALEAHEPRTNQDNYPSEPTDAKAVNSNSTELETELDRLKNETAVLRQANRELKEQYALLQAEKTQAENQCHKLTQQLEKLKEILNRLTKS